MSHVALTHFMGVSSELEGEVPSCWGELKQLTVVKGEKEVEYQSPGACPGSCSRRTSFTVSDKDVLQKGGCKAWKIIPQSLRISDLGPSDAPRQAFSAPR